VGAATGAPRRAEKHKRPDLSAGALVIVNRHESR
jgi:hypothetical protein